MGFKRNFVIRTALWHGGLDPLLAKNAWSYSTTEKGN
jgi:hypothetical protein